MELDSFAQAELTPSIPVIKVIGVGGGGCNAVDRMISEEVNDVEFIALNTDSQVLMYNQAHVTLDLGRKTTRGLGAGANPEIGRAAAEEVIEELEEIIKGADMVFITAGEGGGTGTGAAPVVADIARKTGALTIGVVTHPFRFEGKRRMDQAIAGTDELRKVCDAVIVVKNQNLLSLAEGGTLKATEAFLEADKVLVNGVRGISDLITKPGIINTDFADVRSVMANSGTALMGIGVAKGEGRALKATEQALQSPLIDLSISGATGVLINIAGASNQLGVNEFDEAVSIVADLADPDANIIYGLSNDENLGDQLRVTIVATGFDKDQKRIDEAAANATASTRDQATSLFNEASAPQAGATSLFGNEPETPRHAAYERDGGYDREPQDRGYDRDGRDLGQDRGYSRDSRDARDSGYGRRSDDGGMYAPKRRNLDIPWG
ncbi:MAG: cell division protein FtsZ [Corynebacterium sp.]|nr:cell division protein FtsZ [Corynebacterium sp.]